MTTVSSTSTTSTSTTASTTSTSTSSTATAASLASTDGEDIDWSAIIEAAVAAKTAKADTIDTQISDNETKITAYETMQSLLSDLTEAAEALRSGTDSAGQDDDVFLARTAYLTANGDVDASSSVSATVDDGAQAGSYDLKILQLAKAHKVSSASQTTSTTDLELAGTFTLGIEDGDSAEITVTATMSLAEIAEAINDQSDTTGVQATVLKVTDSSYKLILTSVDTGEVITATAGTGDDILTTLGITDDSGDFANELQASQDAIIELDGVEITRSTNDIDDVLDGVTLHLYQLTDTSSDDASITLEIGTDLSSVKDAVSALVDAYNAYREWAIGQQTLSSDGSVSEDSVLFGDGTLRNVSSAISTALTSVIDSTSMALLGLSFDEENYLVLDEDTLDDALLDDVDAIQSLLAFQLDTSSTDLGILYRGTTALADFTLDIELDADGNITSASIDGDSSMFTISGTRIVGAEGTDYEGYTFVYTGTTSQSVDISISLGIAEQIYNASNGAADSDDGTLQTLIDNLTDTNDDLEAKSDDIRERAETYRDNITARYAKLQAQIESANTMKSYLETLLQAQYASS